MTDARRWELLADALAVGDRLPEDDARFVESFDDTDVQAERDVYDTLAELGEPEAASEEDLTTAQTLLVARRGDRPSRRRAWGIGIAALAAAAILVIGIGLPRAISWTRDEGGGMSAGGLLADVDGSEAEVHDATQERRRRAATAASEVPEEAVAPDDADELRIIDETEVESEAEVARPRSPRHHEPPPTAGELLARARKLVLDGSEAKALAVYERLRRAHPSSSEAHVANVSIGEIQLQRGKASAALAAFDRYLAGGGGSLREEALWGRVRALHRLGRTEARDEAAEKLRKTFPKSVYLSRLPK